MLLQCTPRLYIRSVGVNPVPLRIGKKITQCFQYRKCVVRRDKATAFTAPNIQNCLVPKQEQADRIMIPHYNSNFIRDMADRPTVPPQRHADGLIGSSSEPAEGRRAALHQ
jgi:hypothetical protein